MFLIHLCVFQLRNPVSGSTVSLMEPLTMTGTASQRVAANVRAELAARQIKYTAFAERLGWSKAATSRRLNGLVAWNVDDLDAAASELGVTPASLTAERAA